MFFSNTMYALIVWFSSIETVNTLFVIITPCISYKYGIGNTVWSEDIIDITRIVYFYPRYNHKFLS